MRQLECECKSCLAKEVDRLHRRLWEKRRESLLLLLSLSETIAERHGNTDAKCRAGARFRKVHMMEYPR